MFVPRFEPGSQGYKKKGLTTRRHGQVHIGDGRINVEGVSRLFGETNTPTFWFATIRTTDSRVAIPGIFVGQRRMAILCRPELGLFL